MWVAQAGTIDPYHSTSLLPAGKAAELARIPGVVAALPVYARHLAISSQGGAELDAYAIAIDVAAGASVPPGAPVPARAAGTSWSTACSRARPGCGRAGGSTCSGAGSLSTAARRREQDRAVRVHESRRRAALLGEPGRVSYYLLTSSPAAHAAAVDRRIAATLAGSETHTSGDFAGAFSRLVNSGFLSVVGVLVGIGASSAVR